MGASTGSSRSSFTFLLADSTISAKRGCEPAGARGSPAPSLPRQSSAPTPGAPLGYPFMAFAGRDAGGGKGAAALITAG